MAAFRTEPLVIVSVINQPPLPVFYSEV
jgi:hypothetical protein